MDYKYIASEIKTRVTMPELLRFYGFEIGRGQRIACPFHSGEDKNCGIKTDFIHCFVCGESADVIGFVQKYFSVSFPDALKKINEDFMLGLDMGGRKLSRREQLEMARKAHESERERNEKKREGELVKERYFSALAEYARLERFRREYAPKSADDELHPKFIESLQGLETAKINLDIAETELRNYERAN